MTEVRNDEISLADLWQALAKQRKIVFYIWLVCVVLGLIFALTAKPVYRAEAFLLPPTLNDLQPLNVSVSTRSADGTVGVEKFGDYDPKEVYSLFVQTLNSRSNRKVFYETKGVASKLGFLETANADVFFENNFHGKLNVQWSRKKELEGLVSVSFEGPDAGLVTRWTNEYVDQTLLQVRDRLVSEVLAKVESSVGDVRDAIAGKLLLAQKRRSDRVVELTEALTISKVLSEHDRQVGAIVRSDGLMMSTESLPLYMLSEVALDAEIKVLERRKNDVPFIEGLRDLEEHVATLEQVKIVAEDVNVAFVDQSAFEPTTRLKPNRKLIVLLASLFGIMLGVVVALVRNEMTKKRDG